jgi:hypothetical protein
VTEESRRFICDEVSRQVQPLSSAVAEVKKQNGEQSTIIAMQVRKIDEISTRLRALYGNGTGPPGFLEIARKEDKDKIDRLFDMVDELTAERFRKEGEAELLKQLEAKKGKRVRDLQNWLKIIAVPAGAWGLALLHPVLKMIVDHFASALK